MEKPREARVVQERDEGRINVDGDRQDGGEQQESLNREDMTQDLDAGDKGTEEHLA
jgi:hypothetical protein